MASTSRMRLWISLRLDRAAPYSGKRGQSHWRWCGHIAIGLGNVDEALLKLMANDRAAGSIRMITTPDGMFIYANNAAEMAEALRCIASEVLRLSRSPNSEKQKPSLPLGIKEV